MSKAANIYLDSPNTIRRNPDRSAAKVRHGARTSAPTRRWVSFAVIASMTLMLCLTINYRAFSEMGREISENQTLTNQIQNLTDENLGLQEEIHNLKSDSKSIEREARRMGLHRPSEKVPVPTN